MNLLKAKMKKNYKYLEKPVIYNRQKNKENIVNYLKAAKSLSNNILFNPLSIKREKKLNQLNDELEIWN